MLKPHGNTGKRNAAIDNEPLVSVHVKLTHKLKLKLERYANEKGVSAAEVVRELVRELS